MFQARRLWIVAFRFFTRRLFSARRAFAIVALLPPKSSSSKYPIPNPNRNGNRFPNPITQAICKWGREMRVAATIKVGYVCFSLPFATLWGVCDIFFWISDFWSLEFQIFSVKTLLRSSCLNYKQLPSGLWQCAFLQSDDVVMAEWWNDGIIEWTSDQLTDPQPARTVNQMCGLCGAEAAPHWLFIVRVCVVCVCGGDCDFLFYYFIISVSQSSSQSASQSPSQLAIREMHLWRRRERVLNICVKLSGPSQPPVCLIYCTLHRGNGV